MSIRKNKTVTALIPFLLFITDYICFVLLNAPLILGLIGYLFLCLQTCAAQPFTLAMTMFLLGLQSFMFYGIWGFSYFSLIPIAFLGIYLNNLLIKTPFLSYGLLSAYILSNNLLLALLSGQTAHLKNYTVWQLCATIGMILSMSLIIRVAGTTDNRL